MSISAVLFDLDGTVADTAPDLSEALNHLREEQKKSPLPQAEIRKHASFGAQGLIDFGFEDVTDEKKQTLMQRFLELYATHLHVKTCLFPRVEQTLKTLAQRGFACGIVTNKAQRFAEPILKNLGIYASMQCCVYGDTTQHKKPAPDPLLLAAKQLEIAPENCLYVGDSERDVQAAQAANMPVLITAYGYESSATKDALWGCDGVIGDFAELLTAIDAFLDKPHTSHQTRHAH